jgi:hypothetical protein
MRSKQRFELATDCIGTPPKIGGERRKVSRKPGSDLV